MFHKFTLACLCMLASAFALSQSGAATVTSSEGWTITVLVDYHGMRMTSSRDNCEYGYNYVLEMDYEVIYSDGGGARMWWLGMGGGCFTSSGTKNIYESKGSIGTIDSPGKYAHTDTPCGSVDPQSFACLPEHIMMSGPGIPEQAVPIEPIDDQQLQLPISLTDFSARMHQDGVLLSWITESETDNDYFVVERSNDAISWEGITTVTGAGTTTAQQDYAYTDREADAGINYYRLTQVDFDGSSTTSDVLTVENEGSQRGIGIHPNPVVSSMVIKAGSDVRVYDLRGNDLTSTLSVTPLSDGKYSVDASGLDRGMYLVRSGKEVQRFLRQ